MALGHVRTGQHHLGAHRLEVEDLLPAHLVRDHEDQLVALLLGHQGQAQAGIAGSTLDQGCTRLEVTPLFGGLDHRQADAVLDRTAGVGAFQLQVNLAHTGIQALGLDDGSLPDEFEDGGMDGHVHIWMSRRCAAGPAIIRWMAGKVRRRPGNTASGRGRESRATATDEEVAAARDG